VFVDDLELSPDAEAVLELLGRQRCVLIGGVPAAGKTLLMGEVREAFRANAAPGAMFAAGAEVAVPEDPAVSDKIPSAHRASRAVWQTAMSPSSRFRQFWRDLEPSINGGGYQISSGILYQANEHALEPDGASLVIVDELNRGPAVEVFGPSIVAIEGNKRLDEDDQPTKRTTEFQLAQDDGSMRDYALSAHLYLLAAMNRADVSAEALDAAFLRRWADYKLYPREEVLREHFDLGTTPSELPAHPDNAPAVYGAATRAWREVNRKLLIGAGEDFQIGHGILMQSEQAPPTDPTQALAYVADGWNMIERHVREVFFGNNEAIADALYVNERGGAHPYKLVAHTFAGNETYQLERPEQIDLYALLRTIAGG
jgi:5-methylcytosine-specific restriction protein B